MARSIKVMAEKAAKEWAREDGDTKNCFDQKSEGGKQEESSEDKGEERETVESRKGGENRKKEESTKRDADLQRNTKISKGGRPDNKKAPFPATG